MVNRYGQQGTNPFANLAQAPYISLREPLPLAEMKNLGDVWQQRHDENKTSFDKLALLAAGMQVDPSDPTAVEQKAKTVDAIRNTIKSIAENGGDYEHADAIISRMATDLASDDALRMATENYQYKKAARKEYEKNVMTHGADQFYYDDDYDKNFRLITYDKDGNRVLHSYQSPYDFKYDYAGKMNEIATQSLVAEDAGYKFKGPNENNPFYQIAQGLGITDKQVLDKLAFMFTQYAGSKGEQKEYAQQKKMLRSKLKADYQAQGINVSDADLDLRADQEIMKELQNIGFAKQFIRTQYSLQDPPSGGGGGGYGESAASDVPLTTIYGDSSPYTTGMENESQFAEPADNFQRDAQAYVLQKVQGMYPREYINTIKQYDLIVKKINAALGTKYTTTDLLGENGLLDTQRLDEIRKSKFGPGIGPVIPDPKTGTNANFDLRMAITEAKHLNNDWYHRSMPHVKNLNSDISIDIQTFDPSNSKSGAATERANNLLKSLPPESMTFDSGPYSGKQMDDLKADKKFQQAMLTREFNGFTILPDGPRMEIKYKTDDDKEQRALVHWADPTTMGEFTRMTTGVQDPALGPNMDYMTANAYSGYKISPVSGKYGKADPQTGEYKMEELPSYPINGVPTKVKVNRTSNMRYELTAKVNGVDMVMVDYIKTDPTGKRQLVRDFVPKTVADSNPRIKRTYATHQVLGIFNINPQ